MTMPQPPQRVLKTPPPSEPSKKVTISEVSLILSKTLLPQHQADPNVLKFIKSYLHCRSIAQCAKETGLTKRDCQNLKNRPDIHDAIKTITETAVLKHGYDAADVIERVKEVAQLDPVDLERPDGSFVESLSEVPPEARRAIKKFKAKNLYDTDPNGVRVVVGKLIEVEFWDKMKAVELLGREKDIFKETKRVQHDLTKNMSQVLLESKARAEERLKDVGPVTLPATWKDESEHE